MSKSLFRKKGRNEGPVKHVRLDHYLLKTAAWRSLNATARAIYVEVKFRYNGMNNGCIPYSIREAAQALGIGKSSAADGFKTLRERGFLGLLLFVLIAGLLIRFTEI